MPETAGDAGREDVEQEALGLGLLPLQLGGLLGDDEVLMEDDSAVPLQPP